MTVIYALAAGEAVDPAIAELAKRAMLLLSDLDDRAAIVVLPSIAIAEVLVGIRPELHDSFLLTVNQKFVTPPFDIQATQLSAWLWQQHRQLPKGQQLARPLLKLDVLIVATAKIAGATRFYSHDSGARAVASLVMEAMDLPTHSEQLFGTAKPSIDALHNVGDKGPDVPPVATGKKRRTRKRKS